MKTLIQKAFEVAKTQIGVKEISGSKDNPQIIEYLKSCNYSDEITLHDEIPWCSAFVTWCLQQAGGKGTRSLAARSYLGWGKASKGVPGDVVVLRRGTSSWQGHTGFLVEKGTLYIKVLGGNQANAVSIKKYPRVMVLGYRTSLDT